MKHVTLFIYRIVPDHPLLERRGHFCFYHEKFGIIGPEHNLVQRIFLIDNPFVFRKRHRLPLRKDVGITRMLPNNDTQRNSVRLNVDIA